MRMRGCLYLCVRAITLSNFAIGSLTIFDLSFFFPPPPPPFFLIVLEAAIISLKGLSDGQIRCRWSDKVDMIDIEI